MFSLLDFLNRIAVYLNQYFLHSFLMVVPRKVCVSYLTPVYPKFSNTGILKLSWVSMGNHPQRVAMRETTISFCDRLLKELKVACSNLQSSS